MAKYSNGLVVKKRKRKAESKKCGVKMRLSNFDSKEKHTADTVVLVIRFNRIYKKQCNLVLHANLKCVRIRDRKYTEISERTRQKIFIKIWNETNWEQRKIFVINHVKMIKNEGSKRRYTVHLNIP